MVLFAANFSGPTYSGLGLGMLVSEINQVSSLEICSINSLGNMEANFQNPRLPMRVKNKPSSARIATKIMAAIIVVSMMFYRLTPAISGRVKRGPAHEVRELNAFVSHYSDGQLRLSRNRTKLSSKRGQSASKLTLLSFP